MLNLRFYISALNIAALNVTALISVALALVYFSVCNPVFAGPSETAYKPKAASTNASANSRRRAERLVVPRGPGESSENLKAMLVQYGYNAVADDGAHADFSQVELDSLKEASREVVCIAGRSFLVVYFEARADSAWGSDSIIAVFDRKPKLHLVDAANVQGDRETYIHPRLKVSPLDDLMVVSCCHLNAGEDYCFIALYSLVNGKIKRVDRALPLLYSARSGKLDLRRNYKISVINDRSGKKGKILFNVKEEEIRYDEESEVVRSKRVRYYPLFYFPRGSFYELRDNDPVAARMRARAKAFEVDDPF